MMGQCFPIIGVMRSGTSLVAAILHSLGVHVGDKFKPLTNPSWGPGKHSWSDADFNRLHALLTANGPPPTYGMEPANPHYLPEYEALIREREAKHERWGVKDHWMPFLFPTFKRLCRSEVKPILMWRNPEESARSWAVRKSLDVATAVEWLRPWETAVAEIRADLGSGFLGVSFDALVNDPPGQIKRIADWIGVKATPEAAALVDSKWKRF